MSDVLAMILQFTLMLIGMLMGHHLGFVLMSSGLIVGVLAMGSSYLPFYMNRLWGIMSNWEMLAILYVVYVLIRCYRHPEDGPAMSDEELAGVSRSEVLKEALTNLVPPVLLIIGVLGSIFAGIATPTEAAAIGAFVAFIMVIAYRRFEWKTFKAAIFDTAKGTAMVLVLVMGASFFTGTFIGIGGGDVVRNLLFSLGSGNRWVVFAVMMLIVFVLGMFIDWIGIAMIRLPIFVPIAVELGFDPLWFLMTIAINLQTSFLTPPFGYAIFFLKSTMSEQDMTLQEACQSVPVFIGIQTIGLALCIVFPKIITWLPSLVVR